MLRAKSRFFWVKISSLRKLKTTTKKTLNKLETGTISNQHYKLRVAVYQQIIDKAGKKLNDSKQQAELWLELSNQTFNSVVNIGEVFEMATDEERRKLMKLLGSNWYLGSKKVELTPRRPLDLLHVSNRNPNWRPIAEQMWNYFRLIYSS